MRYFKLFLIGLLVSAGIVKSKATMTDVTETNKPGTSKSSSIVYGSQCEC